MRTELENLRVKVETLSLVVAGLATKCDMSTDEMMDLILSTEQQVLEDE